MKKLLSCVLCVILLLSLPVFAAADSGYSTVSNKNVALEYPSSGSYYQTPLRATVKASKTYGSIYIMPTPVDGNGVLGTVANGTEVTILAEQSGFYFFSAGDGRMGWNGKKFFTVLGQASAASPGQTGKVFNFGSGASITLPGGFILTDTEQDRNNAYSTTYFTNFDQSMDLILTEIDTQAYYQKGAELMNNLYASLKEDYPKPTYDSLGPDKFSLSGYIDNDIYYFECVLSNQVIHLMKMFYPTKNRAVCDSCVEQITGSFKAQPGLTITVTGQVKLPSAVKLPSNPASPYGVALKENMIYGVSYDDWEKVSVINDTYYSRKDASGKHVSWYTSASYEDPRTGYRIGLYYADGLLFFASAYYVGQPDSVTFYYWGDQLLCVHDLRNGGQLSFPGSESYTSIVWEFGDLYPKAMEYAR